MGWEGDEGKGGRAGGQELPRQPQPPGSTRNSFSPGNLVSLYWPGMGLATWAVLEAERS